MNRKETRNGLNSLIEALTDFLDGVPDLSESQTERLSEIEGELVSYLDLLGDEE